MRGYSCLIYAVQRIFPYALPSSSRNGKIRNRNFQGECVDWELGRYQQVRRSLVVDGVCLPDLLDGCTLPFFCFS